MEVTGDRVSIVTDMAVRAENIDEAKVEEARQRAAARLRDKLSAEEVASVNASLARSLAARQAPPPHLIRSVSSGSSSFFRVEERQVDQSNTSSVVLRGWSFPFPAGSANI